MPAEDARGLAGRLQEAVRRPDLWRLAPNPLLLTVMALVHTHKGRLPDARALLYEDTVDILLWRWEQIKAGGDEGRRACGSCCSTPGGPTWTSSACCGGWPSRRTAGRAAAEDGESAGRHRRVAPAQGAGRAAPRGSLDWAQQAIAAIKLRAGLLVERAPRSTPFRTAPFRSTWPGPTWRRRPTSPGRRRSWSRKAPFGGRSILLAVGRLVYLSGDIGKPLTLVGELCPAEAVDEEGPGARPGWPGRRWWRRA